jgi:hypothetical protein
MRDAFLTEVAVFYAQNQSRGRDGMTVRSKLRASRFELRSWAGATTSRERVCVFIGPVLEGQWRASEELSNGVAGMCGLSVTDTLEGLGYACGDRCRDAGADHIFECGVVVA